MNTLKKSVRDREKEVRLGVIWAIPAPTSLRSRCGKIKTRVNKQTKQINANSIGSTIKSNSQSPVPNSAMGIFLPHRPQLQRPLCLIGENGGEKSLIRCVSRAEGPLRVRTFDPTGNSSCLPSASKTTGRHFGSSFMRLEF